MPRYARIHAPGAVVHVIARFVNREFRLAGDAERAIYLDALARSLVRTDWTMLAYALMSSHVHLALLAGEAPPWQLLKSLHTTVAQALNRAHGRFGPVFAERATTIVMAVARLAELVAYLHNNPGRAGLVSEAAESRWTSHRAWIGHDPAPSWLAVDVGLVAAGFELGPAGRDAFDGFVRDRRGHGRNDAHHDARCAETRAGVRALTGLPVEISSPICDVGEGATHEVLGVGLAARPRWRGDLGRVLSAVESRLGVRVDEMRSRDRTQRVVRARRLAGMVGVRLLGRSSSEIASVLGVSTPSLSQLLAATGRVAALGELAAQIGAEVTAASPSEVLDR